MVFLVWQPFVLNEIHFFKMASHARDLLNFKYYRDTNGGKRERAEEMIKAVTDLNSQYSILPLVEKIAPREPHDWNKLDRIKGT